jgi:nucleoside 2-deoxyribosyltransferase
MNEINENIPGDSQPSLPRVYCAGPLFNQCERGEMEDIADVLTDAGFPIFLPHRDGMEFRKVHHVLIDQGWNASQAARFLHEAIFALDVYQLAEACDAMVWNLNGRVPDEGAVSEAAIAWTLGKPLVAYSDDARSLISGRMNPLLVGLVEFETVNQLKEIPAALLAEINRESDSTAVTRSLPTKLQTAIEEGGRLWAAMNEQQAGCNDELIAELVVQLFAPRQEEPKLVS